MSRNIASLWGKHTGVNSENPEIPPMTLRRRCAVSRYVVDPSNALSLILIMLFYLNLATSNCNKREGPRTRHDNKGIKTKSRFVGTSLYLLIFNRHFKCVGVDTLTLIHEIQCDIRRVNILNVLIRKCRIEPPRHEDLEYTIWRIANG